LNSLDILLSFFIFFLIFLYLESILTDFLANKNENNSFNILTFVCYPGDNPLWHVKGGYIGLGKYYDFCRLKEEKVQAFISLLTVNNEKTKTNIGLEGKNISINISNAFTGYTYYYYSELIGNNKKVLMIYGMLEKNPVIINIEIGERS
jgi:hypothetical protein